MANVTIYTTPSCVFCRMTKAYFAANDVQYTEKNVATDLEARKAMVEKSGQLGVPVIDVDGSIVVGFDKESLAHLLHLNS